MGLAREVSLRYRSTVRFPFSSFETLRQGIGISGLQTGCIALSFRRVSGLGRWKWPSFDSWCMTSELFALIDLESKIKK